MPAVLEAPPSPPHLSSAYRGGGGRGRPSWQLWLALAILVVCATLMSFVALRAIKWQPVATILSIAWAVASLRVMRRRFYVTEERRTSDLYLWAIVGGFVAEAVQVVVSGRLGIGLIWIVMGIVGIGGGFGIGSISVVNLWYLAIVVARLLFRWRAA